MIDLSAIKAAGGPWVRAEIIGDQLLILADCREVMAVLPRVDACLTDPPYGIGIADNPVRQKHARKDWDAAAVGNEHLQAIRAISSEQIIWGGNYFDLPPSRGFLIWDKKQPENFSLAMCEQAWWSRDANAKVFSMRVLGYDKQHPTQKPIALMEWCLGFLPDARTILDPFAGSGTVAVACQRLGRQSISIELDADYWAIMCKRVQEAVDNPPLFVPEIKKPVQQGFDI